MAGSFMLQGANGPSVGFLSAGLGKRRSSNNSNNNSCWISWVFFVPDTVPNVLRTLASLIVHCCPLAQATIAFHLDCFNSFQIGGPFFALVSYNILFLQLPKGLKIKWLKNPPIAFYSLHSKTRNLSNGPRPSVISNHSAPNFQPLRPLLGFLSMSGMLLPLGLYACCPYQLQ